MNRISIAGLSVLMLAPVAVSAQSASGGFGAGSGSGSGSYTIAQQCDAGATVSLGFSYGVTIARGSVTYTAPGSYVKTPAQASAVTEEPTITSVDESLASTGRIKPGDKIARVNGYAITTVEGTQALLNAKPGVSLVLTVRRDDDLLPVTIVPTAARCGGRGGAFGQGSIVGGVSVGSVARMAPSQEVVMAAAPVTVTGTYNYGGAAGASIVVGKPYSGVVASPYARAEINPGWLGIGFDCSECGQRITSNGRAWYFREPPVIYNVDIGSPAYNAGIRRGDLLVRVDGKDVTTPIAGSRLGQVKPGETLKLAYRRAGKEHQTTLRVARSPVVVATQATSARVTNELLKSTAELRSTASDARVRDLITEMQRSQAMRDATARDLENALRQSNGSSNSQSLALLSKLRSQERSQSQAQQRALTELMHQQQDASKKLDLIEQQARITSQVGEAVPMRALTVTLDSVSGTMRPSLRDQRLRFSGSIGSSDVEVRGPGAVSVQHDGDDLVIITSDAVIRVKNRSKTGHN